MSDGPSYDDCRVVRRMRCRCASRSVARRSLSASSSAVRYGAGAGRRAGGSGHVVVRSSN